MPNVTYFLKKNPKRETALIIMQMKFNGQKLAYSTQRALTKEQKKFWDKDSQRIKDCKETRDSKLYLLNDTLNLLVKRTLDAYWEVQVDGKKPDPKKIKDILDVHYERQRQAKILESTETLFGLLDRFSNGSILRQGEKRKENTLKCYKKLKSHLLKYDKSTKSNTEFDNVNVQFWNGYKSFLQDENLSPNSIKTDCSYLKSVMNYAVDQGYTTNTDHKKKDFFAKGEKTLSIYLTKNEIEKLHEWHCSDKEIELIKNYFILATQTGLRISDWPKMRMENMKQINGHWYLEVQKTEKTGEPVRILCSEIYLEIFAKYNNKIPTKPVYPKVLAGIEYSAEKAKLKNFKEVKPHTARRSFATNAYLGGMDVTLIRTITGHTTEAAFRTYLKIGLEESGNLQLKHAETQVSKGLRAVSKMAVNRL
jgi:site-specific recombinase XerD